MDKLQKLIEIANEEYDGHFMLMKFTTNWRCCFDTLDKCMKSYYMACGETMDEAIDNCINDRVDVYKIDVAAECGE